MTRIHAVAPGLTFAAVAVARRVFGACKSSEVLNVTTPDILAPGVFNTPTGTDPLRFGVISDFTVAFDGAPIRSRPCPATCPTRWSPATPSPNACRSTRVRRSRSTRDRDRVSSAAAGALAERSRRPRCSPRRTDAEVAARRDVHGARIRRDFLRRGMLLRNRVLHRRRQRRRSPTASQLDAADCSTSPSRASTPRSTLADTSKRVLFGSQIGKRSRTAGPRQVHRRRRPRSPACRERSNSSRSTRRRAARRAQRHVCGRGEQRLVALQRDHEGRRERASVPRRRPADPRIPWTPSTRIGFNSISTNLPTETKFGQTTSGIVGDGTEAQLDILEARLQGGTQADRDAVFAGSTRSARRTRRRSRQSPASAPTTQRAAVDQYFQERAYWTWLTGHRLGDMRRLVRKYRRDTEKVFPTGEPSDAARSADVRHQHQHRDSVRRAQQPELQGLPRHQGVSPIGLTERVTVFGGEFSNVGCHIVRHSPS